MLRLFSSGHLAIIPIAVASGSIAGSAPVVLTEWKLSPARVSSLKYIKCVAQHRTTYTDSPGGWITREVSGEKRRNRKGVRMRDGRNGTRPGLGGIDAPGHTTC